MGSLGDAKDVTGDRQVGLVRVGLPSGRSRTGRGPAGMPGTGRGTLGVIWEGSVDPREGPGR